MEKVELQILLFAVSIFALLGGVVIYASLTELQAVSVEPPQKVIVQNDQIKKALSEAPERVLRGVFTVTAYNVGDPAQTDSTPCIGAAGIDLCELVDSGTGVCASNYFEMGTEVEIEGVGECYILDRMNSKYNGQKRIDVALPKEDLIQARLFGIKHLEVYE